MVSTRNYADTYSQDVKYKMLPFAFALVENENNDSWLRFVQLLRVHVVKDREITLISSRHHGLRVGAANLGWHHHWYYIQHLTSNIHTNLHSK